MRTQAGDRAPVEYGNRTSRTQEEAESLAAKSSHFVTKLHHAALVGLDLREMEGDIAVELVEEWYPVANQDRQDRIANFVRQPEAKAFAANYTAPHKPDATECGQQAPLHELRKIA